MKQFIPIIAFVCMALGVNAEEYRTFANADKSKTFVATVTGVTSKAGVTTASLRTPDKKLITSTLDKFCEDDQAYIKEMESVFAVKRSLNCVITETKSDPEKTTVAGSAARKVTTTDVGFNIRLRNQSQLEVQGLDVKYQVFWKKAERDGTSAKRVDKVEAGKFALASFAAKEELSKETVTVPITIDKANRSKSACSG